MKVEKYPRGGAILKAFVFDLDGVLTETQKLHAMAWKKMFNEFLAKRSGAAEFSEEDYRRYLDGKPRDEGIKSFLRSRQIQLSPDEITALGTQKNKLYIDALKREGPHLIEESFSFVVRLAFKKIPMAVVSSSRNCRMIMEETGLIKFIQVIVTPEEAEKNELRGKPCPDYFLEACRLLRVVPQDCIMVEDAISGIVAGRKAGFGKVVGIKINNPEGKNELKLAGAHEVVTSLWNISGMKDFLKLEDASESILGILKNNRRFFLFLDFDGTISEIVKDPAEARPIFGIMNIISDLSQKMPVCMITGRDARVIQDLTKLPHLYYAACHGFEITGPNNFHFEPKEARKLIPEFDKAQNFLSRKLGEFQGIVIERKRFGLAFHYRMIREEQVKKEIQYQVSKYCQENSYFKLRPGEEVIEILPALNWNKGKAVLKLYDVLNISRNEFLPLYFGDGKTDEDAFREMIDWGISILVSDHERPTLARYRLNSPSDTREFLQKMKVFMETKSERMDSEL